MTLPAKSRSEAAENTFAPFIVRLGGLEVEQLSFFDNSLIDTFDRLLTIEATLQDLRQEMVDRCASAIHGQEDKNTRRSLLAIKRACFNARPLAALWQREKGSEILQARGVSERIITLESELDTVREAWYRAIAAQHRHEQEGLVGLLADSTFRCGLAVAASAVSSRMSRLEAKPTDRWGRKEKRLAATLLRYTCRAAFKTSPFSTFTWVGLGQVTADSGRPHLRRIDTEPTELRSLVRMRRHWLERFQTLLMHYEPFREALPVTLNTSLQETPDGRWRWMVPSRWTIDTEASRLQFHDETVVRSRLRPQVTQPFFDALSHGPLPLKVLQENLADEFGPMAQKAISQFLDLAFLTPVWPWTTHERYMERAMLEHLHTLSHRSEFDGCLQTLETLVTLQRGLLQSQTPSRDFPRLEKLMEALLTQTATAVGFEGYNVSERHSRNDVYQDVWCGGEQPLVEIHRDAVAEVTESVRPLLRYSRLFDRRLDFLYSLGSLLRERYDADTAIPFMEVFDLALPLWRDYVKTIQAARENPETVFNPRELPLLAELRQYRAVAAEVLASCGRDSDEGFRIDSMKLTAWLDSLPARFTEPLAGPGLFLQPIDSEGSLWMLNRIKEGTGRFNSRYTPVMPSSTRQRYATDWRSRSWHAVEGEQARYLDIQCIRGDTLNVHEPQSELTLLLPGHRAAVPAADQRSLSDLFVYLDADGWSILRDGSGRRCLPVHLGGGYEDYMPLMLRMLCAWGPSEARGHFPSYCRQQIDGVEITKRSLIGNVVLQRQSWTIDTTGLAAEVAAAPAERRYEAVQRLRRRLKLPRNVFVSEPVIHPVTGAVRYTPQFLDFESPSLIELFCDMLHQGSLVLWEMLPDPASYPVDARGRHRVTELLLDAALLNDATGTAADERPTAHGIENSSFLDSDVLHATTPTRHPSRHA